MEPVENADISFRKGAIAATIAAVAGLVFIFAVLKGYARGLEHYNYMGGASGGIEGLSAVRQLLYLYIFFGLAFAAFLRWFLLADLKNKLKKVLLFSHSYSLYCSIFTLKYLKVVLLFPVLVLARD